MPRSKLRRTQNAPTVSSRLIRPVRNFSTFLIFGRLEREERRENRRRTRRLQDEEFFCDEFDNETLEEIYSTLVLVMELSKQFSSAWKKSNSIKEKDIRKFAEIFCFEGNFDVFDKMTKYVDRMVGRLLNVYRNRAPLLFVKVKSTSSSPDHIDVCFTFNNNKKTSKYTTAKAYTRNGELLFFNVGKMTSRKRCLVATFLDDAEVQATMHGLQWLAPLSVHRRTLLIKQTPLSYDVKNVACLKIGEKSELFQTEMQAMSHPRRKAKTLSSGTESISNVAVDHVNYALSVESNVEPVKLEEIDDPHAEKSDGNKSTAFDVVQKVFASVAMLNRNENQPKVNIKIELYFGYDCAANERSKDFRVHYLLYRLVILRKCGSRSLRRRSSETFRNKSPLWRDLINETQDQIFLYLVKNHAIQKKITDGEDWVCKFLAFFAAIRFHNVNFEPTFIADVLNQLEHRREQFETLPERIVRALHTAYYGVLCFILNNSLRAMGQSFQDVGDKLALLSPSATSTQSVAQLDTLVQDQSSRTRTLLFTDWKSYEDQVLQKEVIVNLNCINRIVSLSMEKDLLVHTFEKHLQESAVRWFKRSIQSEIPKISEGFETFLQHLAIGDVYFRKAEMYLKYSVIMTSATFLVVEEVKRVIDSQTKLLVAKQTISFDSEYLSKLFFHLTYLSSYIEQRHAKQSASELFNLVSQIKEYLPATVAAAFQRETTRVVDSCILSDETFAPFDVSKNILYCETVRQLMDKTDKSIVLAIDALKVPPNSAAGELTNAILKRARELKTNMWIRLEKERFFINPLKQGVRPQIYVAINSLIALAAYLEGNSCCKKLSKLVVPMSRARYIDKRFNLFANELRVDAKKIYLRVTETVMGMISQAVFHIYTGLECEGSTPSTIRNAIAMLSFQTKCKIQDPTVAEERLIDLWSEFLVVIERFISSFQTGKATVAEGGARRVKRVLQETQKTLVDVVGISKDIINHKNAFKVLCDKLDECSKQT